MSDPSRTIAFQGALGAYSDLAGRTAFPAMTSLPCATFEEAFAAVREKRAQLAMIPIDDRVAGRVADIHCISSASISSRWCITCWRSRAPPSPG